MIKKTILLLIILAPNLHYAQVSGFNENLRRIVVAIEKKQGDEYSYHGTGFILYDYDSPLRYIVTNKHIIGSHKTLYVTLPIKGNILAQEGQKIDEIWTVTNNNIRGRVELIPDSTVVICDEYDLAVFKMELPTIIIRDNKDTFLVDRVSVPNSAIKTLDKVSIGTDVFFIGFPFRIGTEEGYLETGLYSDFTTNLLVRKGIIAWKSETTDEFIVDGFSFQGSSGSPVLTKRDVLTEGNYLIGIVFAHLDEWAKTFSEKDTIHYNAGLARCVSSV